MTMLLRLCVREIVAAYNAVVELCRLFVNVNVSSECNHGTVC